MQRAECFNGGKHSFIPVRFLHLWPGFFLGEIMNSHNKENLWSLASRNMDYCMNDEHDATLSLLWDRTLNQIADLNEKTTSFYPKLQEILNKAAFFTHEHDVKMANFWLDQFMYEARPENYKRLSKNATLEVIRYRLSTRNPILCAAYELRASHQSLKRTIWTKK